MQKPNLCGGCKYFGEEVMQLDDDYNEIPTGIHTCDRIKQIDWSGYYDDVPTEDAFVQDGSGYFAALRVRDNFGCVKWEKKEDEQE